MVLLISPIEHGGIRLSSNILIFNMNSECVDTDAGNISFAIFLRKVGVSLICVWRDSFRDCTFTIFRQN